MIIFFYGKETFQPEQKIAALTEKFLARNPSGAGLRRIDCGGEDFDFRILRDALQAQNLFVAKQLVIIKNPFSCSGAEQDALRVLLEAHDHATVTVLWEGDLPKASNTLFTYLCTHADKQQRSDPLAGQKCIAWMHAHLGAIAEGITITSDAAALLMAWIGEHLPRLDTELRKLANFVGRGVIAADTVRALVLPRADADIFATIGALTTQQSTALFALERQLTKGDDPFYILSMYAYHVRVLLMVSDCVRRGHVSSQEIAKRTNLHPFVVQKSLAALRTFPYERLVALSRRLADLDHHAKTGRVRDLPTALAVFTATA